MRKLTVLAASAAVLALSACGAPADEAAPATDEMGADAMGSDAMGSDAMGTDAMGSDTMGTDEAAPAEATKDGEAMKTEGK